MLMIKLRPVGKKKQISFRVVVVDKKSKLKGKFTDDLGWYNAHTDKFFLDSKKVKKWLSFGVQPTDSVHNLLVSAKLIEDKKIPVHKKSKKEPISESARVSESAPVSEETSVPEESVSSTEPAPTSPEVVSSENPTIELVAE
ncbi:30S ribosomal protein S16 [Candidatus Wolfebacteria bacterium GWA1_42_9]|uniref:Small ribosomal subunit protein bS16 n=2 Tax=Candidatus Wolfeibacteriota TaxID=1752735 RepID=A0A1F8DM30_9BACT|nr:MAG: 30S ribosomal protein S16 [Candidatus Wolfebacteria bacterium GWA1_42_9]